MITLPPAAVMHLSVVAIVVRNYHQVIGCVAGPLGLELVEDCLSLTGHARPRWVVVVRPPGARWAFCWHELARPPGLGRQEGI